MTSLIRVSRCRDLIFYHSCNIWLSCNVNIFSCSHLCACTLILLFTRQSSLSRWKAHQRSTSWDLHWASKAAMILIENADEWSGHWHKTLNTQVRKYIVSFSILNHDESMERKTTSICPRCLTPKTTNYRCWLWPFLSWCGVNFACNHLSNMAIGLATGASDIQACENRDTWNHIW